MQRFTRCTLAFGLGLCVVATMAGELRAQGEPADTNLQYDTLIDSALTEYRLGHWIEAKAYFTQAHELHPNARTERGLGLVCYELRKYVEAIGYFRSALENPVRPLTASMRDSVKQLLTEAERFVSKVELQITPGDAAVMLDGHPVVRDSEGKIMIDAGSHELAAEAPGYESTARTVATDGGELIRLNIALRAQIAPAIAELPAASSRPGPPRAAAEDDARSDSIAPWIVVGTGGAVMVAGAVFLGVALSDKAELEGASQGDFYWAEVEDTYDRVPVFSTIGAIMIGVGAAGIGAGLAWKFWPSEETAPVALTPAPNGVVMTGKF
jgi:hypothetical protein